MGAAARNTEPYEKGTLSNFGNINTFAGRTLTGSRKTAQLRL